MQEYLTDLEILEIEKFCGNPVMSEAVKKVLLQSVYSQGVLIKGQSHNPLRNRALVLVAEDVSNEQLGGKLRSLWEGVNALEGGFTELQKIKSEKNKEVETPYNEAI